MTHSVVRRPLFPFAIVVGFLAGSLIAAKTPPLGPVATTPAAAATGPQWSELDAIVNKAIQAQQLPGAVLIVGHNGHIVYRRAYGDRAVEPSREAMTVDTIFDCASLTKVLATTPAIMQLEEEGKIRLNDPVSTYLPEFAANGKSGITVRELLTHYSGLPPDLDVSHRWQGYDLAMAKIYAIAPIVPPGSQFIYSDINFETLGEIVHRVSGEPLNVYVATHVWQPTGMRHTTFLPPLAWRPKIAPTEIDPATGRFLRGVVHDPTARYMGGVAGHAGSFATADDLARYAQMLLNGGVACPGDKAMPCAHGRRILGTTTVTKMSTPQSPANIPAVRGLGWDIDSPFASNRGELLPVGSFGHTGFTGTSLWIDPFTDTYIVLMSNAIHPHGRAAVVGLRSQVATAVARLVAPDGREHGQDPLVAGRMIPGRRSDLLEADLERITGYSEVSAAEHRTLYRNGAVATGLDNLEARHFDMLQGHRIGLITNQTGVDREGRRNIDVMTAAGVNVTAAFSPEHGWAGTLDVPAIGNTVDPATQVPVFSAYGNSKTTQQLPADGLRRVDMLVYDIQDAGERFYTYETTLGYALEAAAHAHLPIVVLDRPNPIDGIHVQGPALAPEEKSFVGYFPGMPVRNGMTVGELARMFNGELHLGADLHVVAMSGWSRGDFFDEVGLPWINPSPNLRNLTETILYPGVALIEGTNVSVGRGTDTPFEWVGAPWMHGSELAAYLNARRIPAVRFLPVRFTPTASRYANQGCEGVGIILTDRDRFDAGQLGFELASALEHFYPQQWRSSEMHGLAGSRAVVEDVVRGDDPRDIATNWQPGIDAFMSIRARYLLY
ncbi:MAG: exo-beta-N-acetylmuramidase NamZ domain-containing protein [Terriglobales bacterium]